MWNSEDLAAEIDALFETVQSVGQQPSADLALEVFVTRRVESMRAANRRWYDSRGRDARRAKKRECVYRTPLNADERLAISKLLISGISACECARRYEISRTVINRIAKGLKNEGLLGGRQLGGRPRKKVGG